MSGFVRTTSLSLVCMVAAGCHREGAPTPESPDGSKPIAEVEGGGAELAIVAVPQTPASEPTMWLFEPGGRRIASTELGDCTIWDIDSGRTIRSFALDSETAPCNQWQPPAGLSEFVRDTSSADGTLDVFGDEIIDEAGNARKLACPSCASADLITWSASGHQLAYFWVESRRLEIWDADSAKRLSAEVVPGSGEIEELTLTWPSAGALLMLVQRGEPIECDEGMVEGIYCDVDEDGQPLPREPIERRGFLATREGLVEFELGTDQGTLDEVSLDPEGRWLFWTHSWEERRDGTSTVLEFLGLDGRVSGLTHEHTEAYGEYDGSMTREGQWRTDGVTQWVVSIVHESYDGGFEGIDWETTLTHPALGRRTGDVLADPEWESVAEVELFGFVSDAVRYSGQICEGERCEPIGPELPPNCSVLDIASNHGTELLDCGGRVNLRNRAGSTSLPLDADSAFWWWSRSGALVIEDGATFMVIDTASGKVGLQRADVGEVYTGKIGPELDRLVLVGEAGVEVLDLTSLAVVLTRPEAATEFAFSPTGDRLALFDGDEIHVLELPSGKQLASWEVGPIDQLAFRQDGQVIYIGGDRPEAGFDAASGEPLDDPLVFTKISEAIEQGGEIDPSWRWIMHDEFGELVRTIDGRTIEWLAEGAWLPDTGQYSGKGPGPELAFRIGDDPWTVPEFDAQQLAKWLQRRDLEQAFLSGQAIAKPTITAGELQGLRAKGQGKPK